jgi:hypothetical protein
VVTLAAVNRFEQRRPVVNDEELAAEAMAAEPDPPLGDHAAPLPLSTDVRQDLLPDWYVPARTSRVHGRARRWLLGGVVVGLLVINGVGLCDVRLS